MSLWRHQQSADAAGNWLRSSGAVGRPRPGAKRCGPGGRGGAG